MSSCGVTAMNTLLVYLLSIKIVDCSPSVYRDPKSGEEPNKSKDMLLIPDSDCWNECSAGCRHKILNVTVGFPYFWGGYKIPSKIMSNP